MSSSKTPLSGLSAKQIEDIITQDLQWEKYRSKQIHSWIYSKLSNSFDEWLNLSLSQRTYLKENYRIPLLKMLDRQISKQQNTEKYLFELSDGKLIESVLMKFSERESLSVCLSSQVGCSIGCPFCATGRLGLKRHLTSAEIVDQLMCIQRLIGEKVDNLVFMGQGEPLHNLDNVLEAVSILRHSASISSRKITISTSGLVPQIRKLAKEKLQIHLAISLHSAVQDLREKLVPIAKTYPMYELIYSLREYFEQTGRRITFEYVMLKDVNDSNEQAWALCDLVRDLPFSCLINLIPYNSTSGEFKRSERIESFREVVSRSGRKVTVRATMGEDIAAACGQLANK